MTDKPIHPATRALADAVRDLREYTVHDGVDLAAIFSSLGTITGGGVLGELAGLVGDWSDLVDGDAVAAVADRAGATAALRQVSDLLDQARALASEVRASL